MSQTEDVPTLEPLEESASAPTVTPVMQSSGMSAPAYNPRAHKEYYRFFFAGVIMVLACMMPFGPEDRAYYTTLGGGFFMLISLGVLWAGWVAIAHNKFGGFSLRWIALAFLPFLINLMHLISWSDAPAIVAGREAGVALPESWKDLFSSFNVRKPENAAKLENFTRYYGSGKLMMLFGSAYAEFQLFRAIMGGAKAGKEKKVAAQQRRSRR